ncbi:eukaryotic-like serine/threonine-protein kinase [Marmoricola sp. URHA0025 HA25]
MIAGRYSLDREIGRGGTGAVWLGRDELLGRQVALKQIGRMPGTDSTDLARAEREARLGARLNHAHVVAIFDVVTDPDTEARWLVMEHVDGMTLAELVRDRGALSPDEAAPLLWQAADALVAAHAAGIAHRDVKPSNILVDAHGHVKLTDFGIARVATDPALTRTGLVTGSPAYLAPEVATGDRGDVAADVWSLGATAFHALAGRPPYEIGDNVLGALYRIVHDDPPQLPEAGWMAPLLAGTMVKDPTSRWSMEQVRDFLAGRGRTVPVAPVADAGGPLADASHTRVLATVAPAPVVPESQQRDAVGSRMPPTRVLAGGAAALLVVVAVVLFAVLHDGSGGTGTTNGGKPSSHAATAKPTAKGMETFIRDYVATVSDDPDKAWAMLTPKFQRESGGIERYRSFWDSATNGRVLSISADPATLTVSYQVRFDDFHNGPGPTVLDLAFADGRYLIDGEHSKGFVPED